MGGLGFRLTPEQQRLNADLETLRYRPTKEFERVYKLFRTVYPFAPAPVRESTSEKEMKSLERDFGPAVRFYIKYADLINDVARSGRAVEKYLIPYFDKLNQFQREAGEQGETDRLVLYSGGFFLSSFASFSIAGIPIANFINYARNNPERVTFEDALSVFRGTKELLASEKKAWAEFTFSLYQYEVSLNSFFNSYNKLAIALVNHNESEIKKALSSYNSFAATLKKSLNNVKEIYGKYQTTFGSSEEYKNAINISESFMEDAGMVASTAVLGSLIAGAVPQTVKSGVLNMSQKIGKEILEEYFTKWKHIKWNIGFTAWRILSDEDTAKKFVSAIDGGDPDALAKVIGVTYLVEGAPIGIIFRGAKKVLSVLINIPGLGEVAVGKLILALGPLIAMGSHEKVLEEMKNAGIDTSGINAKEIAAKVSLATIFGTDAVFSELSDNYPDASPKKLRIAADDITAKVSGDAELAVKFVVDPDAKTKKAIKDRMNSE
ncbi:MAG: hypothetical protein Q7S22_06695 [Candidatus Micrarchaeota archaeon]|nr:hypothetical protein [Candidatus Micrarchaeota archaeon]